MTIRTGCLSGTVAIVLILATTTHAVVPTLDTTSALLNGVSTGFDAGGNISDDGGLSVTARGVCWNTTGTPTTADASTNDGSGTGVFTSHVAGLAEATHYYFRAYATNGDGTAYGDQKTIITGSSRTLREYEWFEGQPATNSDQLWSCAAMSADGTKAVVGISYGRIYTSSDSGTNWIERRPGDGTYQQWSCAAISADGTRLVTGVSNGRLYASGDSGETWTESRPAGNTNKSWASLAMSSDGRTLLAGVSTGRLYLSTDFGTNWTEMQPCGAVDASWRCVAVSADGTRLVAGVGGNGGRLYTSDDAGTTWIERRPAGDADKTWFRAAISSDGTRLLVIDGSRLYMSSDSGLTWTERQPNGNLNHSWACIGMSSDGTKLIASYSLGYNDGRLYTSFDSGETWTEREPTGSLYKAWNCAIISADGSQLLVAALGGRLYCGMPASTVITASAVMDGETAFNAGGNILDDCGAAIVARGVCWNTMGNPTITDASTSDGAGTGIFTSRVTGLEESTHYYFRAYATNANGTVYGDQKTIITGSDNTPAGYAWAELQPNSARLNGWGAVAMSPDGTKMIAGGYSDYVYASPDSGASWIQRRPAGSALRNWSCAAISADGARLAATCYTSDDFGVTWRIRSAISGTCYCLAASSDGDQLMVTQQDVRSSHTGLYRGSKGGATWTEVFPTGDASASWLCAAMSSDGTRLLAGGARLFFSSDSGLHWVELRPAGDVDADWACAAMTSDGSGMFVGANNGRLYSSNDAGTNWTEVRPAGDSDKGWKCLAMSADGRTLAAAVRSGRLYTSFDAGHAWTEQQPAGNVDQDWSCMNLSADGLKLLAGTNTVSSSAGRLFLAEGLPLVTTSSAVLTGSDGFDAGGTVTDDGAVFTARGVCWNTTGNPTIAEQTTHDGSGPGTFTSHVAGLAENTHYYFRAYATSAAGTFYGEQRTIITGASATISAYLWAETRPGGDVDKNWRATGMSADGNNLIAAVYNGRLYTSIDGGTAWIERTPAGDTDIPWATATISSCAPRLLAAHWQNPCGFLGSTDLGANWTAMAPKKSSAMVSAASTSSDGTRLASTVDGQIFVSTNSGTTWSERPLTATVAGMSSDGMKLIAGVGGTHLYTSTNLGLSWTERQPAGSDGKMWACAAMSTDGTKLIAGAGGTTAGRLYTSSDAGASWVERRPAGNVDKTWGCAAMSADGTELIAAVNGGRLYASFDAGATWAECHPAGVLDASWATANMSSDGMQVVVGANNGRLYVGRAGTRPFADFNDDGLVNDMEMTTFVDCAAGPFRPIGGDCVLTDLNGNGFTDMLDFAILQRCLTDGVHPQTPGCAD